jgi:hypothetical protein
MFISDRPSILKVTVVLGFTTALAFSHLYVLQAHEHENDDAANAEGKTVTGEVVDLMCYIDHNATGEKHAACAPNALGRRTGRHHQRGQDISDCRTAQAHER